MSGKTEAEIRAAVEAEIEAYPRDNGLRKLSEGIERLFDPIAWQLSGDPDDVDDEGNPGQLGDRIWRDLRPSEAARIHLIVERAKLETFALCRALIVDQVVKAGLAFAAEFPKAPRSAVKRRASTARRSTPEQIGMRRIEA
jgi:hypothetical protein